MPTTRRFSAACLALGALLLATGSSSAPGPGAVPAFPGAEGAGALTRGGRGGRVIEVTNLADHGPGSLREALQASGPRIVIFRVSGRVALESPIVISAPYLTVAGQTAPGDGICVSGETVQIDAEEVVVRYLRFRRGYPQRRDDALNARGSPGRIILDHCSFSWGSDENVSLYRYMQRQADGKEKKLPIERITIQWCISSEALDPDNHAFGGTWGGRGVTFHHNLFACNTGRNPSIGWGDGVDFRNNVLFNWRHRTVDGGDGASLVNVVANFYQPGPATQDGPVRYRIAKPEHLDRLVERSEPGRWYVAANVVSGFPAVTADNWDGGVQYDENASEAPERRVTRGRAAQPVAAPPIRQQNAQEARELVLDQAGATLPRRDSVDARIIASVRSGQTNVGNGIIQTPADVGGWPEYRSIPPPLDSDEDGMPDAWERRYELNPKNPADGARDDDRDGYTNVEEWLNGTDPKRFVDYALPENNVNTLP